jgi:hypothetical protein
MIQLSPDYYDYNAYYSNLGNINFFEQRFEPGYYNFAKINSLFFSFNTFFFISTIVAASAKIYTAYCINRKKLLFFISAYILLAFIIIDVISLRANLAISFFILAFNFFYVRKNYWLCVFFGIISIGFHYSIIILFAILPFIKNPKKMTLRYLLILGIAVFSLSNVAITIAIELSLNPLLEIYAQQEMLSGSVLSSYSLYLLIVILMFSTVYNRVKNSGKAAFALATLIYIFATSLIFIPVVYFRYLDFTNLLLLYFIISLEFSRDIRFRYWMCVLVFSSFCIFKITSLLVFSPVLLSASH